MTASPKDAATATRDGLRVTWVGVAVNALLILIKGVGGVVGGSQALIADAVHSFSDFFSDAMVLVGLKVGRKDPDEHHHFGHGRIETLASVGVALTLMGVAAWIAWSAGLAILRGELTRPSWLTVVAAALSIVSKEILYRYTIRVGQRIRSTAVIANAWHHRSDALSSVAVLGGVVAAQISPALQILDSFAALVVAALVLHVGVTILWQALKEFTDMAPGPDVLARMRDCALSVDGVLDIHDLRVRTTGGLYHIEVHVEVDGDLSVREGHAIGNEADRRLREEVGDVCGLIVHVDPCKAPERAANAR